MKILGKDFTPSFKLRSMFIFESLTDKPFEVKTSMDIFIYFFSCLVSNKDNPALDFDEFIDWCDEHPELIVEFTDLMNKDLEKKALLGSKKKVTENS